MKTDLRNQSFGSGLMFIGIGALGLWFGRSYRFGTAVEMGPGYFPTVLCAIMVGIGAVLVVRGVVHGGTRIDHISLRPLAVIAAALLLFAALVESWGMVPASIVLVATTALASREMRLRETLILAAALTAVASILFIKLLGMPVPYLRW